MRRSRKRQRTVLAEEIIDWVWEDDDPAAPACESRHLDISDQSLEATELRVYDSLLACSEDKTASGTEQAVAVLDRTLANILVFADDCQAAVKWLRKETVTHSDEQGRRAGQRRRHLKERGLLKNNRPFVRLCGQVIIDSDTIAISAARQCINDWEESGDGQSLHFHKEEDGMRWRPESTDNGRTATMDLANPYTAPPPAPEPDGRTVHRYRIELGDHEHPKAERSQWTNADGEDADHTSEPVWVLNTRAESAVEWLAFAAETVANIATDCDENTLRQLFPSLREIHRQEEREAAASRAAQPKTTKEPAAQPDAKSRGTTIH